MLKRILCLLFVVLMIPFALFSCTKDKGKEDDSASGESVATADLENDHLEARDYDGKVFRILSRESTAYEFMGDSTGSNLYQKVKERDLAVESRFHVKIEQEKRAGDWTNRDDFSNYVSNLVLSGNSEAEESIHMISTHAGYLGSMAINGYGLDMTTLPNIDFTQSWWTRSFTDGASVDGKVYFTVGDINLTLYEKLEVVFFNKKLADDHHVEDLYAKVADGSWTYAEMFRIAKEFGGSKETGMESYALLTNCHASRAFVTSWNIKLTRPNADTGRQELYLTGNQKLIDGYEAFYRLMTGTVADCPFSASTELATQAPLFAKDQSLFWTQMLQGVEEIKRLGMTSEFGILPFPLWDEAQFERTGYISAAADNHNGIMVPSNVKEGEKDMVGMIIEALCMYSRSTSIQEYYETYLKYRSDTTDARIISVMDTIRAGMNFSFAQAWSYNINYLYSYYSRAWANANNNGGIPDRSVTTQINKYENGQKTLLADIYKKLDELNASAS